MEDLMSIQFLEYLEPIEGEPELKSVRSFMVKNYTKPKSLSHFAKNDNEPGKMMMLDLLDIGLIEANRLDIQHICDKDWTDTRGQKLYQQWFDTFDVKAKITQKGLDKLNEYRSTLHLITDTLKSNKETTDAVKKGIDIQLSLGITSTIAIVATAVIAFFAYTKDDSPSMKDLA